MYIEIRQHMCPLPTFKVQILLSSTCTKSTPLGVTSCQPKQIIEGSSAYSSNDDLSGEDEILSSIGKRSTARLESDSDQDLDTETVQPKQPKEEKKYKRFKFEKTEDRIPLPDPFELPKYFRPDVASALASGKMTIETSRTFLSTVAVHI